MDMCSSLYNSTVGLLHYMEVDSEVRMSLKKQNAAEKNRRSHEASTIVDALLRFESSAEITGFARAEKTLLPFLFVNRSIEQILPYVVLQIDTAV